MTILNLDQYKLIHPRGWNFSIPLEVLKDWMKLRQLDFVRDEGFFCITLETSNNMSYNLWIEYGKPVYLEKFDDIKDRAVWSIPKYKAYKINKEKDYWNKLIKGE